MRAQLLLAQFENWRRLILELTFHVQHLNISRKSNISKYGKLWDINSLLSTSSAKSYARKLDPTIVLSHVTEETTYLIQWRHYISKVTVAILIYSNTLLRIKSSHASSFSSFLYFLTKYTLLLFG